MKAQLRFTLPPGTHTWYEVAPGQSRAGAIVQTYDGDVVDTPAVVRPEGYVERGQAVQQGEELPE